MDYEKLKELIAKVIKENGRGEITGPVLQSVLMAMVNSLGEAYPQTYTEEEKAQARANIDALSDHNGEITKEKLSLEVQAILNDVANKQNITDESLATIAKTIVGAINEVYKGGLKDASIATSKIEDGAITEDKLASQSVTNAKIANASVSEEKIIDNSVSAEKLKDGAITEPKLDTDLNAKVNNNVKTVEQTLSNDEVRIASKNLKFRDDYGNFFADKISYDAVLKLHVSEKLDHSILGNRCTDNKFGHGCYHFILGNGCSGNIFGDGCSFNILGNGCSGNIFGDGCSFNILGNGCSGITFGDDFRNFKIDTGVSHITINGNSSYGNYLQNIHILSGVHGEVYKKLTINIPDEYRNSSRELIITTKRTDGGPLTPEDIVMYYADEVVDKLDNTSSLTDTEINNIWDNN